MDRIRRELEELESKGNFRRIPFGSGDATLLDFSTNDYLGLGADTALHDEFFADESNRRLSLTSSASRLLAADQDEYLKLEDTLAALYGRPALLFNSGYHANAGLISALADKDTLIIADKLVHASIIDGYKLSAGDMQRFRHNDMHHLERLLKSHAGDYKRVLIVAEGVYSMDGDTAPIADMIELKKLYPNSLIYIDEAHSFGACGCRGLGLVADMPQSAEVDVIIGTFGKAAASQGAFAALGGTLRDYAVNRARSFIFSTAIPPLNCAWTRFIVSRLPGMTERRAHLRELSQRLFDSLDRNSPLFTVPVSSPSHIMPVVVGDAHKVIEMSLKLLQQGVKVLPIRTPTVPPNSERLRVSLSAAMSLADVDKLANAINSLS